MTDRSAHLMTRPAQRFRIRLANVLPLVALAVFGALFVRHLMTLNAQAVWAAMAALGFWQIAAALVFTALSFRALGLYDILVHRVLGTGQTTQAARASGIKAIAVSQMLGFGTLTAALVRWRCLPQFSAAQSLRLSVVISVSFLVALVVVAGFVVPLSGLVNTNVPFVAAGLAALGVLIIFARIAPLKGWLARPVAGSTLVALIFAALADTAFAGAALWMLWPDAISFQLVFAAYLVALGAGLLSNAPGGVGAFDLTLLALLPVSDDEHAMAAVLAFRVIYYGLPAGLALLSLIKPSAKLSPAELDHPEAALRFQDAQVHRHAKAPLLTLPAWGNGAVLGDLPITVAVTDLRGVHDPRAIYKCSARQTIAARKAGWAVVRCASEAVINPQTWTTAGSNRRQLRRALATFEASGLTIAPTRDMAALAPVCRAWAHRNGREKGHSMGRYCPDYLSRQRVFAAFDKDRPVAFISLHTGPVWTLDVMRYQPDIPNGTMHALVRRAIDAAAQTGVTRLSLAAVPDPAPRFPFARLIIQNATGLRRFKSAFAPTWQPRYACAQGRAHLWLTGLTLAYAIHRPLPLPDVGSSNLPHGKDEDFSFAPAQAPCEAHLT